MNALCKNAFGFVAVGAFLIFQGPAWCGRGAAAGHLSAAIAVDRKTADVEEEVVFTAGYGLGEEDRFHWYFADGESAEGKTVSHSFAREGTYPVSVLAEAANGERDTAVILVRIGSSLVSERIVPFPLGVPPGGGNPALSPPGRGSPTSLDKVALLIDQDEYSALQEEVDRYIADVEARFPVDLLLVNDQSFATQTSGAVRTRLQALYASEGISGAVLAGSLPYALWHQKLFEQYGENTGPCVLMYEDLDGEFLDTDTDGVYDSHPSYGPHDGIEIWTAFIRPFTSEGTTGLKEFFDKTHAYYTGETAYRRQALVYEDGGIGLGDDFWGTGSVVDYLEESFGVSNVKKYGPPPSYPALSRTEWLEEVPFKYEFAFSLSHGNSVGHYFTLSPSGVTRAEVDDLRSTALVHLLMSCSAGNFHSSPNNNIALSYVNASPLCQLVDTEIHVNNFSQRVNPKYTVQNWTGGMYYGKAWGERERMFNKAGVYPDAAYPDKSLWQFILIGNPFIAFEPPPSAPATVVTPYPGMVITESVSFAPGTHVFSGSMGIVISGDGITIDGRGAVLQGPGWMSQTNYPTGFTGTGISSYGYSNVTMRNVSVRGFNLGIKVINGQGWTIEDSDFSWNYDNPIQGWYGPLDQGGISLEGGGDHRVIRNRANYVWNGLRMLRSSGNTAEDNDFSFCSNAGMLLLRACGNQVLRNDLSWGARWSRGKPVTNFPGAAAWRQTYGSAPPSTFDAAGLLLYLASNDNYFEGNDLRWGGDGAYLILTARVPSTGNVFYRNNADWGWHNCWEANVPGNTFIENSGDHGDYGWYMLKDENVFRSNSGRYSAMDGFFGECGEHSLLEGNDFSDNLGSGIFLRQYVHHWTVRNNDVSRNGGYGIKIWSNIAPQADWIELAGNTAEGNGLGVVYAASGATNLRWLYPSSTAQAPDADLSASDGFTVQPRGGNPGGSIYVAVGQEVVFDASRSSDPISLPLSCRWDLRDGTVSEETAFSHAFAAPGLYSAGLSASNGGLSDPDSADVYVVDPQAEGYGTEGNGAAWSGETLPVGYHLEIGDDGDIFIQGEKSVRVSSDCIDGYYFYYPSGKNAGWDLSGKQGLSLWFYTNYPDDREEQGIEKYQPEIFLHRDGGTYIRYRMTGNLLNAYKWNHFAIPLAESGDLWERTAVNGCTLEEINYIRFKLKTGSSARRVKLYIDGLTFPDYICWNTPTPSPTASPTPSPSATPTVSPSSSPTATVTPVSPSPSPSATATPEGYKTPTPTPTVTSTPTPTPGPERIYYFPLDSDPGWTAESAWAFGRPMGGGSYNRDPSAGYTGDYVYGYNLAGDYTNNLAPARNLTSPPLDCSRIANTSLRFRRWLGVESSNWDHAAIEISTQGTSWHTVWMHNSSAINDSAWSLKSYSIATFADGQSSVFLRWAMGTTDESVTYPGWNIDDIEIWGVYHPSPTPSPTPEGYRTPSPSPSITPASTPSVTPLLTATPTSSPPALPSPPPTPAVPPTPSSTNAPASPTPESPSPPMPLPTCTRSATPPAPSPSATPVVPPPTPVPTISPSPLHSPAPTPPSAPSPSPSPTGINCFTVAGQVLDSRTSEPIPGAFVRAVTDDLVSDIASAAGGGYQVSACSQFSAGSVRIEARARGYLPGTSSASYAGWNAMTGELVRLHPSRGDQGIVSGDYDGDGTAAAAIFRPGDGLWSARGITRFYFGVGSDEPVPADYNGDGTTDPALFRPSSGLWAVRSLTRAYFGGFDAVAVPGDYDADGICEPAIFLPRDGQWAVRGVTRLYFGSAGNEPLPGDYDGDARKDFAVFRASDGRWSVRSLSRFCFGASEDRLVPGDWAGNGSWIAAVCRPAQGMWSMRGWTRFYFGSTGDRPAPADYDGNGVDDAGIFRASSGLWAVRNLTRVSFGSSGDVPATR